MAGQSNPFDRFDKPTRIPGGIVIKDADPTEDLKRPRLQGEIAGTAVSTDNARTNATVNAATAAAQIAKAQADARKAAADATITETTAAQGGQGKNLSAEVREKALKQFTGASLLGQRIAEIERNFAAGPGATTGLRGLRDFFPSPANKDFDTSGDAVRGAVKQALGMTGGENNTATESKMNLGPYVPQSSDYDSVIRGKIARLKEIQDNARTTAIQTLGGVPDAQGNIAPANRKPVAAAIPGGVVPPGSDPGSGAMFRGPGLPPAGGGDAPMNLASGSTRTELDPERSALLERMMRNGATFDQINAEFPSSKRTEYDSVKAALAANPNLTGFAKMTRTVPNSAFERVASSPFGVGAISAADAILPAGVFGQDVRDKVQQAKDASPMAALAGSIVGGVPAAGALELGAARLLPGAGAWVPRLADAVYGGYQGAGNADDGNGLVGAAEGAGAGILGGIAGRGVARGVGSALQGVTNNSLQYLRGEGVRTTVGQTLGGTAKQIEDQATGYPLIGGIIKGRREEGLTDFNHAMNRQASLNDPQVTQIGERGAEQLDEAVTRAYAPINNATVQVDAPFVQDLNAASARAARIPGRADDFTYTVGNRVGENIAPGTAIPGRNVQDAIRGLRYDANNQGMGAMHAAPYADALGDVGTAVGGLLERQAPDAAAALARGNEIYRNQSIVDEAVKAARQVRGPDGNAIVMPSQLNTASVLNTNKYGGRSAAATTDRPFYDLATAGQDILPSKTGDSGTAARLALAAAASTVAGGGAYGASGDGGLAGAGEGSAGTLAGLAGLAALGGSRGGQRALVSLLADRPDLLRRIGSQVYDRGALIGGPLGVPLASQAQQLILAP